MNEGRQGGEEGWRYPRMGEEYGRQGVIRKQIHEVRKGQIHNEMMKEMYEEKYDSAVREEQSYTHLETKEQKLLN